MDTSVSTGLDIYKIIIDKDCNAPPGDVNLKPGDTIVFVSELDNPMVIIKDGRNPFMERPPHRLKNGHLSRKIKTHDQDDEYRYCAVCNPNITPEEIGAIENDPENCQPGITAPRMRINVGGVGENNDGTR